VQLTHIINASQQHTSDHATPTKLGTHMARPGHVPFLRGCLLTWLCSTCVVLHGTELTVLETGSAAQLSALGNEALMQGRYETAIEHYKRALTNDKTSFQATFNLALAYQYLENYAEARRWYDEALKISPDHAEALCNLGYLAYRAGQWELAEDNFLAAARQATSKDIAAEYWFNAATAREKRGHFLEARRAYDECLSLNSQHFSAHYNLGTLFLGALSDQPKALEKAEAALKKAHELAPTRAEALVNLGLCLERQQRDDDNSHAKNAFDQAVAVAAPTYKTQALWNRALFFDRQKPPQRLAMRDDLQAILALDGQFPGANGLLGAYHYALGEFDAATTYLHKEITGPAFDAQSTIDVESHYLLAMLYTDHRPHAQKALDHASAYYQLRPDSAKIQDVRRRALRLSSMISTAQNTVTPAVAEPISAHTVQRVTKDSNDGKNKTTTPDPHKEPAKNNPHGPAAHDHAAPPTKH
jgi:tetratricopeptide (TPR) repeat protein